ncbi:uncharacterized protein LOC131157453 [Malania oleifera]|uniref:uncharacterized protein LOC131157453 n=1 Tax=Malania oleifera TaxID=397392 RepID=UPI0025AE59DB|nr:uncharacterized protein LOC131157453 [Malania oleifera]
MAISGSGSHPPAIKTEAEFVRCESCGFTEECTPAYIARVRDRYGGRWICGLCAEAVKYEALRSERRITTEEALDRHINICDEFRSSGKPSSSSEHPISAMGRRLRRSLDTPAKTLRSNSSRGLGGIEPEVHRPRLLRSGSCFSALSR